MLWRPPRDDVFSSTWNDVENQGHPLWKNRRFSVGGCNFGFQQHTDIIPTAKPTFSTMADFELTLETLAEVDRRW